MESLSIRDINLEGLIISKFSDHFSQKMEEIIKNKINDINNLGYCLWAHGHLNLDHTRDFCSKIQSRTQKDVYVLMPYTNNDENSNRSKKDTRYHYYRYDSIIEEIPEIMSEVRGAEDAKAFYLDGLYELKEKIDFSKFYNFYNAINSSCDNQIASKTLNSQCTNKCIELIEDIDIYFELDNSNIISESGSKALVARLKYPYHVELLEIV